MKISISWGEKEEKKETDNEEGVVSREWDGRHMGWTNAIANERAENKVAEKQ